MNIEKAYDKWAETYDVMSNKTRDMDLIATNENLGHTKFHSILEIGCGTGKNTQWLAHRCLKLVAVDFSKEMMLIAKQKVLETHIEWLQFDVSLPWPLQRAQFDLITFNLVLEHVRDLDFVFVQAASRLAKGGMIHLSELHPFKQYLGSKARFESEQGVHEVEAFTHHISDYTTALSAAGFRLLELKEWFDRDRNEIPRLLTMIATAGPSTKQH
jgi:malonyl-CoA O-methyltransferase